MGKPCVHCGFIIIQDDDGRFDGEVECLPCWQRRFWAAAPRAKSTHEKLARIRATLARVREICAGDHEAAYDLRADILAELGGET